MAGSDSSVSDGKLDKTVDSAPAPSAAPELLTAGSTPVVQEMRQADKPVHPDIAGRQDAQVVKPAGVDGQTGQPETVKKENEKKVSEATYTITQGMTVGADSMGKVTSTVNTETTETATPAKVETPPPVADTTVATGGSDGQGGNKDLDPQAAMLQAAQGGDKDAQAKAIKAGLATEDTFKEKKDAEEGKDDPKKKNKEGEEGEDEEAKAKKKAMDGSAEEGKDNDKTAEAEKKNPDQLVDELTKRIGSREAAAVLAARDATNEDGDTEQLKKKRV